MSPSEVQIWVGIVGTFTTIVVSLLGVLGFQRRRDRSAAVGTAFREVIEALASENPTRQMAAAILIRRFFDAHAEQGSAGVPYAKEAVAVIAGLLRQTATGEVQKALADGLRFAPSLAGADLQRCNLERAYLGVKAGDPKVPDLSHADLFEADLSGASLRGACAEGAVFYGADMTKAVFRDAVLIKADLRSSVLTGADFRGADLTDAQLADARIEGARFGGATGLPKEIAEALDAHGRFPRATSASLDDGRPAGDG